MLYKCWSRLKYLRMESHKGDGTSGVVFGSRLLHTEIDLRRLKAAPLQAMGDGHVRGRFREPPAACR